MIRAFIFDLDGTLYPKSCLLYFEMSRLIKNWFLIQLKIGEREAVEFFDGLKLAYPNALEAIQAYGLSLPSFHRFVFGGLSPDEHLREDREIQRLLSILSGQKFLVTFSSHDYSLRVLRVIGVDQFFSEIYNPGVNWFTCQKIDAYETIRIKYGLRPEEICIVGDNYEVDLRRAKEMGYGCVLISEGREKVSVPSITQLPSIIECGLNLS